MATDEEVEAQRDRVHELRAQLEESRTGGAKTQRELDNEIVLTQLQAEEARIQAQIDEANERNSKEALLRGAAAPLGTVREQMEAAVAHQQAVANQITETPKVEAPPQVLGDDKAAGKKVS